MPKRSWTKESSSHPTSFLSRNEWPKWCEALFSFSSSLVALRARIRRITSIWVKRSWIHQFWIPLVVTSGQSRITVSLYQKSCLEMILTVTMCIKRAVTTKVIKFERSEEIQIFDQWALMQVGEPPSGPFRSKLGNSQLKWWIWVGRAFQSRAHGAA